MTVIDTSDLTPRWTRKPKARPDEVLSAALALFARNGFAATRMEDIARAAGLSKAAIYLYFASKEEVFKALVETRVVVLRDTMAVTAEEMKDDPIAGLRKVMAIWSHAASNSQVAAIPRIVLAESVRFPELAQYYQSTVMNRTQKILVMLIEQAITKGLVRPIDPLTAARAMVSPLLFELLRRQAFPAEDVQVPLPQLADTFFDIYLNGILADPAKPYKDQLYEKEIYLYWYRHCWFGPSRLCWLELV